MTRQHDEIELDEWVVMPNHFHGIIVIADGRGDRRVAPMGCTRISGEKGDRRVAPVGCTRISGEQVDRRVAPMGCTRISGEQVDRRVAPVGCTRISFEQGDRRVAPTTEIREPSAMYGHGAPCPNEAAWMI
ncbi:hypothetical protein B2D07_03335 [Desulfococcus multivorans]|nr:uncharacterized protein Dmul_06940 [Desulfococcus multivorans]AQU99902.1 hypothetical protein B2D07_03335 [Desulfococcus multivorans]